MIINIRVNGLSKYSFIVKIDCRVPQGYILGPLLILLYANEMKQAGDCDLFQDADDSCLVYHHREK